MTSNMCDKCKNKNRASAKFCKFCSAPIKAKKEIKKKIDKIEKNINIKKTSIENTFLYISKFFKQHIKKIVIMLTILIATALASYRIHTI
jgi:ABC-type proline/glycine betaine transport system permease subunit